MAQGVHEAVESFIGDGLSLETAPREDDGFVPGLQRVEEAANQRGLAHPRAAVYEERHGAPFCSHHFERVLEQGELLTPAHERETPRLGDCRFRASGSRRIASHLNQDLLARRAAARVAPEQADAEPVEIVWNPRRDLVRGRRLSLLLLAHHLRRSSHEGTAASQPLVHHDAQAVPVARLRDGEARPLLRRHVCRVTRHRHALIASGRNTLRARSVSS